MSADFTPEKEDYKILTPFKMQVLTNFPYIEADFDALTNYELLCKIVEYLNAVIANENEVTEQITSLYNAYVSLQDYVNDYFDNLDVQEEINNKLDELADDGTLTQLIKGYVDPIYEAYETTINANICNQNANITAISNKVDAATNGSPLVASSTDDMTDTTKVYVNTTDGKWYYYDGDSWEIGGTYQATRLDDNSVNTTMLEDNTVIYEKLGDYNLKAIEDYFVTENSFSFDTEKIISSTSTSLQNGNLTNYSGGINIKAVAFPFVYDEDKQYRYLIIPQLKIYNDGYLHVTLGTTPSGSIVSTDFKNSIINETKRYFTAGDYTNVVIPLFNFDYSTMTDEGTYYFSLFELSTEITPAYNSLYYFDLTNNTSPNSSSSFISDLTAMKMLNGYGGQVWTSFAGGTYPQLIPAVGLTIDNPLEFSPESISSDNKLKGKKINFMGDSITQGLDGGTSEVANYPFPLIIANETGATCRNYGIAGSTIGGDGTTVSPVTGAIIGYLPMVNRIESMDTDVDINVIFGGTNDALADRRVDLGTINDTTNLTFYGALNNLCSYLLTNFPAKTNLLVTPFKRQGQQNPNQYGYYLQDYVDAIVAIGKKYGIPVFNFFDNMGGTIFNTVWKQNNVPDGTHPNQAYYYKVAAKIIDFISNNI